MLKHDKVFPLHTEQCWRYSSSKGHLSAMWKLRTQHSSVVGFLAILLPGSGIKSIIIPSWMFQGLSLGVDDNRPIENAVMVLQILVGNVNMGKITNVGR